MNADILLRKVFLELDVGWDYPYFHSLRNGGWIFGATPETIDDFKIYLNGHEIEILNKQKGRPDVVQAFPDFQVSPQSGFDFYLNPLILKTQEENNYLEIKVFKGMEVIFSRGKEFCFRHKMTGVIEYPQEQGIFSSRRSFISGWILSQHPLVSWELLVNGESFKNLSVEQEIFRPDLLAFYRGDAFGGKCGFKIPFYPWVKEEQNQLTLKVRNNLDEEIILTRNFLSPGLPIISKLYYLLPY